MTHRFYDRDPSQSRREIVSDMQVWGWKVPNSTPNDNLTALMALAPDSPVAPTMQNTAPQREAVRRAIRTLGQHDRWIVEATYFEQIPLSELGHRLGVSKSHARRLRIKAVERLETALLADPSLQRKMNMQTAITDPTTWNEAATEALIVIEQNAAFSPIHKTFDASLAPCIPYVNEGHKAVDITAVDNNILDIAITAWLALDEDARNRMFPLLCERQAKYGPNNILKFGTKGIIIRMSDKVERIRHGGGDFVDDSVEDSYMDLVGYAAIHWMCANGFFELPLEK